MSDLQILQHGFIDYLLGKESGIDQHIQSTPTLSAGKRLNIYAYAYKARLKEAVTTDYEKLHSYLGDEQFDQVMERYIEKYPSQETNLRYYSIKMPALLRDEEPFNKIPMLAEIADIEAAFANSFDAKDSPTMSLNDLASLPDSAWKTLRFSTHPSIQLLSFNHNSFDVWKALSEDKEPPEMEHFSAPETRLMWRDSELITRYRPLSAAEATALAFARQGQTFAAICESLLDHFTEEEVPVHAITFLQTWVQEGLVSSLNY
ncbi:MAG: hypothetical protein A6F71_08220 [Cycloclasticus sp. symbiont of Poecilosclerida sp. M]|nr:MAG: hypothetical protein A6F71_08220 [Cycloclasticus sp. symbiont of Poecilosclerida sp. M]